MNNNISSSTEKSTLDFIREFAAQLLNDGIDASDVCFYLTAAGIELAFMSAPSAEHAISVVSSALFQVSKSRISEESEANDADDSAHETDIETNLNDHVDGQTIH